MNERIASEKERGVWWREKSNGFGFLSCEFEGVNRRMEVEEDCVENGQGTAVSSNGLPFCMAVGVKSRKQNIIPGNLLFILSLSLSLHFYIYLLLRNLH